MKIADYASSKNLYPWPYLLIKRRYYLGGLFGDCLTVPRCSRDLVLSDPPPVAGARVQPSNPVRRAGDHPTRKGRDLAKGS